MSLVYIVCTFLPYLCYLTVAGSLGVELSYKALVAAAPRPLADADDAVADAFGETGSSQAAGAN